MATAPMTVIQGTLGSGAEVALCETEMRLPLTLSQSLQWIARERKRKLSPGASQERKGELSSSLEAGRKARQSAVSRWAALGPVNCGGVAHRFGQSTRGRQFG